MSIHYQHSPSIIFLFISFVAVIIAPENLSAAYGGYPPYYQNYQMQPYGTPPYPQNQQAAYIPQQPGPMSATPNQPLMPTPQVVEPAYRDAVGNSYDARGNLLYTAQYGLVAPATAHNPYSPQCYNPAGAVAGLQHPGLVPAEPTLFASWTALSGQKMHVPLANVNEPLMDPQTKNSFKIFASNGQQQTDVTHYFGRRSIAQCAEIGQQLIARSPQWIQWWNERCNGLLLPTPERKTPLSPSSDTQSAWSATAAETQVQLDAAKAEIERLKQQAAQQIEELNRLLREQAAQQTKPADTPKIPEGVGIVLPEPEQLAQPPVNSHLREQTAVATAAPETPQSPIQSSAAKPQALPQAVSIPVQPQKPTPAQETSLATKPVQPTATATSNNTQTAAQQQPESALSIAPKLITLVDSSAQDADAQQKESDKTLRTGDAGKKEKLSKQQQVAETATVKPPLPVDQPSKQQTESAKKKKPRKKKGSSESNAAGAASAAQEDLQRAPKLDEKTRHEVVKEPQPAQKTADAQQPEIRKVITLKDLPVTPAQAKKLDQRRADNLVRIEQLPETKAERRRRKAQEEEEKKEKEKREQAEEQARLKEQQKEQAAANRILAKQKADDRKAKENQELEAAQEQAKKEAEAQEREILRLLNDKKGKSPDTQKEKDFIEAYFDFENRGQPVQADAQAAAIEQRYAQKYDLSEYYAKRASYLFMRLSGSSKSEKESFLKELDKYTKRLIALGRKNLALSIETEQLLQGLNPEYAKCKKTGPHEDENCCHTKICSLEFDGGNEGVAVLRHQGLCYVNGWGVKRDEEKGQALIKKASQKGDLEAQIILGGQATPDDIKKWRQMLSSQNAQEKKQAQSYLYGFVLARLRVKKGDNCFKRFGDGIFGELFEKTCLEMHSETTLEEYHASILCEGFGLVEIIKPEELTSYFISSKDAVKKHSQAADLILVLDYVQDALAEAKNQRVIPLRKKAGDLAAQLRRIFPDLAPSVFRPIDLEKTVFPPSDAIMNLEQKITEKGKEEDKLLADATSLENFCEWLRQLGMVAHQMINCENPEEAQYLEAIKRPSQMKRYAEKMAKSTPGNSGKKELNLFFVHFAAHQLEERITYINQEENEKHRTTLKKKRQEWVKKLRDYRMRATQEGKTAQEQEQLITENAQLLSVVNATEALMYFHKTHPDQEGKTTEEQEQLIKEKAVPLIEKTEFPPNSALHKLFTTAQGVLAVHGYLFTELTPEQREKEAIELFMASIPSECLDEKCKFGCLHNPIAMRELARILWKTEKKQPPKSTFSRVEQLLLKAQENDDEARIFLTEVLWHKAIQGSRTQRDIQRFRMVMRLCRSLQKKGYEKAIERITSLGDQELDKAVFIVEEMVKNIGDLVDQLAVIQELDMFATLFKTRFTNSPYNEKRLWTIMNQLALGRQEQPQLTTPLILQRNLEINGIDDDVKNLIRTINSQPYNAQHYLQQAYAGIAPEKAEALNGSVKKVLIPAMFATYATDPQVMPTLEWWRLFEYLNERVKFSQEQMKTYTSLATRRVITVIGEWSKPMGPRPLSEALELMKLSPLVVQDPNTKSFEVGTAKDQIFTLPSRYEKELVDVAQTFCAIARIQHNSQMVILSDIFKNICASIVQELSIREPHGALSSQELEAYASAALYLAQGLSIVTDQEKKEVCLKTETLRDLINRIECLNGAINRQKKDEHKKILSIISKMMDLTIFNVAQEKEWKNGDTEWQDLLEEFKKAGKAFSSNEDGKLLEEQLNSNSIFRKTLIENGIAEFGETLRFQEPEQPRELKTIIAGAAAAAADRPSPFVRIPHVTEPFAQHAQYLSKIAEFGDSLENFEKIVKHLQHVLLHRNLSPEESSQLKSTMSELRDKALIAFKKVVKTNGAPVVQGTGWLTLLRFAVEKSDGTSRLTPTLTDENKYYMALAISRKNDLEKKLPRVTLEEAIELAGLYPIVNEPHDRLRTQFKSLFEPSCPPDYQEQVNRAQEFVEIIKTNQSPLIPALCDSVAANLKKSFILEVEEGTEKAIRKDDLKNYVLASLFFARGLLLAGKLSHESVEERITTINKLLAICIRGGYQREELADVASIIAAFNKIVYYGVAREKEGLLKTTVWQKTFSNLNFQGQLAQFQKAQEILDTKGDRRTQFITTFLEQLQKPFVFQN